jgi:hypothetical protein
LNSAKLSTGVFEKDIFGEIEELSTENIKKAVEYAETD